MKSFYGHPVSILHFCGRGKKIFYDTMFNIAEAVPITLPDNVSIVSTISSDVFNEAPLHYQCQKSGVKYYNSDKCDDGMWTNRRKPRLIVDALEKVTTDYCLILDGLDVVFCDSAENILYPYSSYERDIIFNTTSNRFPDIEIERLECPDEQRKILYGTFCYLNAGMCIGKTETLNWFYTELIDEIEKTNVPFEQYHVRKLMGEHQDKVFMDYDCKIFQAFNRGTEFLIQNQLSQFLGANNG